MNFAREIPRVAKHIQRAEEVIRHQEKLISKFEDEGLPTPSEIGLLHVFQNVLRNQEAKLARLLYEQNLQLQRFGD